MAEPTAQLRMRAAYALGMSRAKLPFALIAEKLSCSRAEARMLVARGRRIERLRKRGKPER